MDPTRPDRILEEWDAVSGRAHRPAMSPRRSNVTSGRSGATLAGASLVVVALVVAVTLLGRPGGIGDIGGLAPTPTPTASATTEPSASPSATPSPSPSPSPTASPTPSPTPSPAPTVVPTGSCDPSKLAARITAWEGAAGHRIADVELTNAGAAKCKIATLDKPQLVDGHGSVLIDGVAPGSSSSLTLAPGEVVKTLVQDANYCGPDPAAPVSVAFVMNGGGRFVATPLSPTDATVPPCNGPGSPADIEMQPWAR
jgi:hypothetical protein